MADSKKCIICRVQMKRGRWSHKNWGKKLCCSYTCSGKYRAKKARSVKTKKCPRCKLVFPIKEFGIRKHNGLPKVYCRPCELWEHRSYYGKYKRKPYRKSKNLLKRDRTKNRTREATRKALADGVIKKTPCQKCGSLNVEAHHTDYSKPLEVMWLCRKHHFFLHRKNIVDRKIEQADEIAKKAL